jgi:hypothetical protein
MKNMLTGYVEEEHIDPAIFDEQVRVCAVNAARCGRVRSRMPRPRVGAVTGCRRAQYHTFLQYGYTMNPSTLDDGVSRAVVRTRWRVCCAGRVRER